MSARRHVEHHHQVALFRWARLSGIPQLRLMFAIPNAARRSPRQGKWMKDEGMKAGVPDVCLPVPRNGYVGLWIEMKADDNKPTDAQTAFHVLLREQGHRVEVMRQWTDARDVILTYLREELDVTNKLGAAA